MHNIKPSHVATNTRESSERKWMASDAKSRVHSAKQWKINQISISKLKVWNHDVYFLLNLLCNTEHMMLLGAMMGVGWGGSVTVLWSLPNYIFTWILIAWGWFILFSKCVQFQLFKYAYSKKELFSYICQRQTESTYYEI